MKIEIEVLADYHECETCGYSSAGGGIVYVDGEEVLRRCPVAYCYGSADFSESDLLVMALKKIGTEVLVDGNYYFIGSHDEEYHGYKLDDY